MRLYFQFTPSRRDRQSLIENTGYEHPARLLGKISRLLQSWRKDIDNYHLAPKDRTKTILNRVFCVEAPTINEISEKGIQITTRSLNGGFLYVKFASQGHV